MRANAYRNRVDAGAVVRAERCHRSRRLPARSPLSRSVTAIATVRTTLDTSASPDDAWAAIRDIGALHTRLATGFVADAPRAGRPRGDLRQRNGHPRTDRHHRRRGPLLWSAEGGRTTHYNASLQVSARPDGGATVVWVADFLPDDVKPQLSAAIEAGTRAMKRSLDALGK